MKLFAELLSVECEDSIHFCPDTYSCCVKRNSEGKAYGCCPVEDAVCCDDGINWYVGTLSFCLEFFLNSFVFSVKQLSERV